MDGKIHEGKLVIVMRQLKSITVSLGNEIRTYAYIIDSVNDIRSLCDAAYDSIRTLFIEFKMKHRDTNRGLVYKNSSKQNVSKAKPNFK